MSKYVCPICGKSYDDVNELSNCVAKCAKEKTAASEQLNKLHLETYEKHKKDLNIQKDKVSEAYNTLLAEIEKYNDIANKIKKINSKFNAHCSSSLSFDSNTTNKVSIGKPRPRTLDELEEMNLNELVDKFLEIF